MAPTGAQASKVDYPEYFTAPPPATSTLPQRAYSSLLFATRNEYLSLDVKIINMVWIRTKNIPTIVADTHAQPAVFPFPTTFLFA
ncbi:hypothetical protein PM082_014827 [Marasmius tenuissimus]|nr:hypothetical protein PM082_014827 [Marasmius tenuissimus]